MKRGLRRIAAYLIDYGVILIWIGLLFAAASTGLLGFHSPDSWTTGDRWIAQGQGFLAMTLPVYLYFTLLEAFGAKATLGKCALRLQVQGSLPRIALRNMLKFLPWELAHFAIWHTMPRPMASQPSTIGLGLMCLSMAVATLYVASLFIEPGRTPYDRISHTTVIPRDVTRR